MGRKLVIWVGAIVLLVALSAAALYVWLVPGLSSARSEPPAAEVTVATWLLHHSVPTEAKLAANPVGKDPADVTAGRDLYRQKCELCHAYDGSGKTSIGAGQYPHPPALRSAAVEAMPDGEIFYHIRNGIRNTAMPAWGLPDREIWQLVSYIRDLPQVAQMTPSTADAARPAPQGQQSHYVGSAACKNCHENVYARWSKTLMANVVRDPRQQPDAIIPDLSKPDPLLNFTKDDVALDLRLAAGSSGISRKSATTISVYPSQWDVTQQGVATLLRRQRHRLVGDRFIPPDNIQRPTGPLCDGCHSVNYNISDQNAPRSGTSVARNAMALAAPHVAHPDARQHPQSGAASTTLHANDACIQCHSQGQPLTNPIQGKYYDWPVGFEVGNKPCRFLEARGAQARAKPASPTFRTGPAHKNRMQGNDFVAQPDVRARRDLLQLPRSPWHATTSRWCASPATPYASIATARMRKPGRTPRQLSSTLIIKRAVPATNASLATCPKVEQTIATECPQPHLSFRDAGRYRGDEDSERL